MRPVTTKPERAEWARHAGASISGAGLRAGAARKAVVDVLAQQDCCLSAREIRDALAAGPGPTPGMASVYRALAILTDLHSVHRVDLGGQVANYEHAHPGGDHHLRAVCRECGTVVVIEDDNVETAIRAMAVKVMSRPVRPSRRCERRRDMRAPHTHQEEWRSDSG